MGEKRTQPRHLVDLDVTCETADGSFAGKMRNLSVAGAFVEALEHPGLSTWFDLLITLPRVGHRRLTAVVRWTTSEGFGVQFGPMGAQETHALIELTSHGRSS
jgi:type IV pilus assembly protein PilZ